MLISYWDCKFNDYDEIWDGEDEIRIYGCSHPDNAERRCHVENKWCDSEAECKMAEKRNAAD